MEVKPFYDSRGRVRGFMQRHRIGLLTLVFTDIVGSVNLKRVLGDGAAVALIQQHHARLRELLARFNEGEEIDTAGDSFLVVFSKPSDAVHFALSLQSALRSLSAEAGVGLKDRIGIHVGEVFIADSGHTTRRKDLFGIQVDTCARVMSLGGGDQILMTQFAFDNARHVLLGQTIENLSSILWLKHGLYEFDGVAEPLEVCEVGEQGLAALKAPADTGKAKRHASGLLEQSGWRPAAGQSVPGMDWKLEAKLGEGGFGEVWRAARGATGEVAAFKFSFRNDGRFFLENAWKAYQKLLQSGGRHPGIVEIFAAQLDHEPCSLRLELVAGNDLAAWCAACGGPRQIRLGVRVDVIVQVAEALQHAHVNGVTHKDLKPSNILVFGEGRQAGDLQVKLTDFGFWHDKPLSDEASHRTTTFIGSPLYLSPEQASGETQIGPAADIYALGLIFYELLTGRPPFVRASFSEIMDAHRYEDARLPSQENPDVPNGLERICLKAMEKRPQDRYGSAMEMADELRRFTRGERIATRPKQYDNVIASRIRRHIDELKTWRRDELLTDQEFAGLARAYSRFDRSGGFWDQGR